MYQDNQGYVTVGIGHLLRSARDAQRLPFQVAGTRPPTRASTELIARDWARILRAPRRLLAAQYGSYTLLTLTAPDVDDLFRRDIQRFTGELRGAFPDYDTYPHDAQLALLDVAYNVGSITPTTFPNLMRAVKRRDWTSAAAESHRNEAQIGKDRNAYTRDLFSSAARADTVKRVGAP